MNHPPTEAQNTGASTEELEEDLEGSAALLSRYGFEIRMGLAILGVLGFIFAAVFAYRMLKLRQDEVNRTKRTETAHVGTSTESQTSGQSQSSGKEVVSRETAPSPPPFALDFPTNLSSPPPSPPSGATGETHTEQDQRAAQAWVIPPDDPLGETPLGSANQPKNQGTGYVTTGDNAGMDPSYAQLTPAGPVANNTAPGLSNDSSFPYTGGQNNVSASTNAGGAGIPDFFAENRPTPPTPPAPGLSAGSSQNQHDFSAASASGQNREIGSGTPFPGDFFAGGTAVSTQGNVAGLPSAVQPAGNCPQPASNDNRLATSNVMPTVDPFSRSSGTINPELRGPSAGLPQGNVGPTEGPSPYSPPLVAGQSDVMANPDPMAGNYITHTVQEGETLFDIARQRLGKASRWVDIYQLNRSQLGERLEYFRPGLTLRLPDDATQSTATSPTTLR